MISLLRKFEPKKYNRFAWEVGGRSNQKGQALLIVLLTMAAVIVVVLSVVSKSVTDITVTSTEEDSSRAFSAAEAGVEDALLNLGSAAVLPAPIGTVGTGSQTANYAATVAKSSAANYFDYPEQLLSGDTATIWFADRDANGNLHCGGVYVCTSTRVLNLYWGSVESSSSPVPAVVITFYYDPTRKAFLNPSDYSGVVSKTYAFDASAASRGNYFYAPQTADSADYISQGGVHYKYLEPFNQLQTDINTCVDDATPCLIMARVRMLYNTIPQGFGVKLLPSGNRLPAQGYKVSSSGIAGQTKRQVEVFQGYPEPPSIFDSVLFSLQGLEKN